MKLPDNIKKSVKLALDEDIGSGDVTAQLIPRDETSKATVLCRVPAVLAGTAWFDETFRQVDRHVKVHWLHQDGDLVDANMILCELEGNSRSLLSGERVALNFLQLLSATATQTYQYVKAIEGTSAQILDTRKTIPGLRKAQKYAVLCGGGKNHRIGLYDMVLIKENHIMAAGSITAAIEQARKLHPTLKVEVETENLNEFQEATSAGADVIMLDEFSLEDMKKAVFLNDGQIKLEASGGVNPDTIRALAETGVDYISIGGITKDIKAIDLSMRFQH